MYEQFERFPECNQIDHRKCTFCRAGGFRVRLNYVPISNKPFGVWVAENRRIIQPTYTFPSWYSTRGRQLKRAYRLLRKIKRRAERKGVQQPLDVVYWIYRAKKGNQ